MKVKVTIKTPDVTYPYRGQGPFGTGIYAAKFGSVRIEGEGQSVVVLSDGTPADPSIRIDWRRLPDDTAVTLKIGKPPEVVLPVGSGPTVTVGEVPVPPGLYSGDAGETVIISDDILLVIKATGETRQRLIPGAILTRYPEGTSVALEYV